MKRRYIAIGLTLLASLGIVAGCGKKSADSTKTKSDADITVWDPYLAPSSTVSSWKKSPFHTGLAKASGIKVDWQFPSEGTDWAQAYNLMMSEKTKPDIIHYTLRSEAEAYIKDGTIYDLTKLLPKKAPNYWKFLKSHPEFDKAVKTDSGKYFGFGFFREDPSQGIFIGPQIRQDWLDADGLKSPTNIKEWEAVLKDFKEKHHATMAWVNDKMDPGLAGAFGAYATALPSWYIDKDGKTVKFAQAQPEWRNYMAWLHKMYQKGYIDPDVVTMDDAALETKVSNDKVGIAFTYGSRLTIFNDNAKKAGSKANWQPVMYANQADGKKSASIYANGQVASDAWVVTTSAKGKELDKALKWLDYAYSKEGNLYWNMGTKGVSYTMKDGKPVYTDKVLKAKIGISEARKLYTGNTGSGLGMQDVSATATNASSIKTGDVWFNNNKAAADARLNQPISMTSAESKEFATISNTLNTYVTENAYNFITGDKPISEYDDFVKELNKQGLKKLEKIRQAAFDRYLKR
ncbi:hypothetical protein [Lacticaseibacillus jixiensis]|uniref:hypothetical protein n=1 Tax=Lacticaseibacillus jixiensis TaxID=3231926 RepID=UPI0036F2ADC0